MASGIVYVPCPECGKRALELVNFRLGTVSVECDHCGYSRLPLTPERKPEPAPLYGASA